MPLAAPRSVVAVRLTKPVAMACAKKVPTPTSTRPIENDRQIGRRAATAGRQRDAEPEPERRAGAEPFATRARYQRREDRRQEHEVDEAERHRADGERRPRQHEVDVGERADEREQDAEADRRRRRAALVAQMHGPGREGRLPGPAHHRHRRVRCRLKKTSTAPARLRPAKHVEIGREPEMIGDRRRHQSAEQVARDVTRDIGREGAGRIGARCTARRDRRGSA